MTAVEEKIAAAVLRTRCTWSIGMGLATLYTFYALPLWAAIFLIPIAFITYLAAIALTVMWLQSQLSDDEAEEIIRKRALQKGSLEKGGHKMFCRLEETAEPEVVAISEFSPSILGHIGDHSIYEWVKLTHPRTQETDRYYYHSPARYNTDGTAHLPEDDEKLTFAYVDGVIYVRGNA